MASPGMGRRTRAYHPHRRRCRCRPPRCWPRTVRTISMIPNQENQMVSPPLRMPTEDAPTPPHIEVVPPGIADHGTEIGTTGSTVGIEVKNLNAWFGKAQVLYEIAMSIKPRQVTAIIGPSGCGKSTYVRCLNRMHETIPT